MKDPKKLALQDEMSRRECRFCLFFDMKTKRCSIGIKNCPLTMSRTGPETGAPVPIPFYPCTRCSYGRGERPCVSFCMKKVLKEWREMREKSGKEGADDA